MNGSFLKGAAVGLVCALIGSVATVALGGSGIGGVFNLGQTNTVDAQTKLTGSTAGSAQLQVNNTNTGSGSIGVHANNSSASAAIKGENSSTGAGLYGSSTSGFGVQAQSSGASTATFQAQNTGGGTAGSFIVNSGTTPFKVNSTTKVASLNADQLDGLDSTALQKRVSGTCLAGMAIQIVNADGTVSCLAVGTGGGWSLTGNTATTPGTNFLGTTDAHDLVVKTNNNEVMRATMTGDLGVGTSTPSSKLEAVDSGVDPTLAASNTGSGPAASFQVSNNGPPFTVNTTAKVPGLNADFLDGLSASGYQRNVSGSCGAGSAIGSIANNGTVTCNDESVRPGVNNGGLSFSIGANHCARFELAAGGIAVGDSEIIAPDAATWPADVIMEALRADHVNEIPVNICNLGSSTASVTSTVSFWFAKLNP